MMSAELYKVLECPEMGRYGVASRDLRAGEIAYEDTPFAVGPSVGSAPLCLECACPVDGCAGGARCPRCGWPLCEKCGAEIEASVYHKAECELFAKHGSKFQNVEDSSEACVQLDCITPLRVLLAKEANPDWWNAEIVMMEDHRAERDGNAFWKADQSNVVAFLRDSCGLKDRCSEELIQKVIGILDVNAFEAHTCSLRGLYPKMGIMAHSCVTNLAHTVHPSKGYRWVTHVKNTTKLIDIQILGSLPGQRSILRRVQCCAQPTRICWPAPEPGRRNFKEQSISPASASDVWIRQNLERTLAR